MSGSPLVAEAMELLRTEGVDAAAAFLERQEPAAAADAWSQLVIDLYWKAKNLEAVVVVGRRGIDFALQMAAATGDERAARQLKAEAKAMAYNLGSYTWEGWAEPGIRITTDHRAVGRWAAELNLRLAHELQKRDAALSRAHWLIGAVQLADRHVRAAAASFAHAATLAERVGATAEQRLSEAYRALAAWLERPDDAERRAAYDAAREAFAGIEDGDELVGQLETARRIFSDG